MDAIGFAIIIFLFIVAAELISGVAMVSGFIRYWKTKLKGVIFIPLSDELKQAIAFNLINVGSELIAGMEHEMEDGQIKRYSAYLDPDYMHIAPGTVLRIRSIGRQFIEVSAIDSTPIL